MRHRPSGATANGRRFASEASAPPDREHPEARVPEGREARCTPSGAPPGRGFGWAFVPVASKGRGERYQRTRLTWTRLLPALCSVQAM